MQQQSRVDPNINNDEIDLIELIFSIWKKKWWVVLITVLFALVAVGYALTAKEQWTSKAEIIAPRNYEIENTLKERLAYARITDGQVGNLSTSLYGSFTTELRSVNSRVDFFKQSNLYQKLTKDLEQEAQKLSVLRGLTSSISIEWPDEKKQIDYPTVSFSTTEPIEAQQALEQYIDYLNKHVFALAEQDFLMGLRNKIVDLQFNVARTEERLPLNREIALETKQKHLQRALATAKAAGIKEYAKTDGEEGLLMPERLLKQTAEEKVELSPADDETSITQHEEANFLLMPGEKYLQAQISARFSQVDQWFLLGEKYLQAQLDNVEKIPLIFPPEYHYQKTQLQQLEKLLTEHKTSTSDQSFHYQSAPYLPLTRDKPKRALIVLIGTFLGGIIGVIVALFMAVLDNRKAREQQT